MALKSAATARTLTPYEIEELQMEANNAAAMQTILDNLDKDGQLTRWLKEYSKKIESYSSGKKIAGARAAKKK
jgi:hypothetical protein